MSQDPGGGAGAGRRNHRADGQLELSPLCSVSTAETADKLARLGHCPSVVRIHRCIALVITALSLTVTAAHVLEMLASCRTASRCTPP